MVGSFSGWIGGGLSVWLEWWWVEPLDGVVVEDVAAIVEVVEEALVVEALALVEGVVVVNLHNN